MDLMQRVSKSPALKKLFLFHWRNLNYTECNSDFWFCFKRKDQFTWKKKMLDYCCDFWNELEFTNWSSSKFTEFLDMLNFIVERVADGPGQPIWYTSMTKCHWWHLCIRVFFKKTTKGKKAFYRSCVL